MASLSASSTPACSDAAPLAHAHRAPTLRGSATSCSWYLKACPCRSRSTSLASTPSAWTCVRPASPSCRGRRRRAANPEHYDEKGRPRKRGKGAPRWKQSRGYQATRRRKAARERKLAAHRKSLHGRLVHQIVAVGHTIVTEKISYKSWQKRYGKSVGLCAPGKLIAHLRRTLSSTGGNPPEVPTRSTKLSQYCHGCGTTVKKALWQARAYEPR